MAVVRLKRRCGENPVDSLLFASKRLKTEEGDSGFDPKLFTFAATVASKEQEVHKILQSENISLDRCTSSSTEDKKSISAKNKRISDITEKLRQENQLHSQNNRYEVVNLYRNLKPEDSIEKDCTPLTVIDIVNQDKNEQEMKESEYVYDLYYTQMGADLDELITGNTYSIVPIQDELYQSGQSNNTSAAEDDEDSNEEDNVRNDYPDEDEVKDDEDEYKSEEDYEGEICDYEEDPDVSGMANDFIGQCRLADSEDDMYTDSERELSSDENEEKLYDEDLVISHSSYATYVKKKQRREAYCSDIDDLDEYS